MQIRRMFGAMFRLKTESFSNKKMSKLQVSAFVVILWLYIWLLRSYYNGLDATKMENEFYKRLNILLFIIVLAVLH